MRNIKITIKKELRGVLRDKKSLLMMALTPLFIPVFVFLITYIYDSMINKEKVIYKIGTNYEISDIEKEITNQSNLELIKYKDIKALEKAYENKEITSYITKEDNNYTIYNNSSSEDGSYAGMYINSYLESYNNYLGSIYLSQNNIDTNLVYNNISYSTVELKGSSVIGSEILNMAIIFTIMAITLTAVYSSTDATAGEKERGTLETLLTYPIKSSELILGKFFAITISAIITLIISILFMIISLTIVKNNFEVLKTFTFNITPFTILITFIVLVTYAFFISGLCIAIASRTKTFKEAQSTLTPVSLLTCFPMFLQMLDIKLGSYLYFIPMFNHSFILNDIMLENIDIESIIITTITSIIYSLILIYIIIKEYRSEKILFD